MNTQHWAVADNLRQSDLPNQSQPQPQPPQNDRSISLTPPKQPQPTTTHKIAKLEVAHAFSGFSFDGHSLGAKLSPITYQNLIRVIVSNPNNQSSVSHNPLKRLTRAKNKSLIDQTKEVMSEKMVL
jgi:hypothetical protein